MNANVGYFIAKVISKLKREKNKETINSFFKSKGVHFEGHGNYWINSNIAIHEPHLIHIGSNTTIAGNVEFVTHDNSISKVLPEYTDLFGEIHIGKNCFIGARSVILYGVSIADNVIVAAGSVVTKSITQSNIIVGGNPAKVIGSWDSFASKSEKFAWDLNSISRKEVIEKQIKGNKLIKR